MLVTTHIKKSLDITSEDFPGAREARPRKITNEAQNASRFVHKIE